MIRDLEYWVFSWIECQPGTHCKAVVQCMVTMHAFVNNVAGEMGEATPYNGLNREALPERDTFCKLFV